MALNFFLFSRSVVCLFSFFSFSLFLFFLVLPFLSFFLISFLFPCPHIICHLVLTLSHLSQLDCHLHKLYFFLQQNFKFSIHWQPWHDWCMCVCVCGVCKRLFNYGRFFINITIQLQTYLPWGTVQDSRSCCNRWW